MSLGGCFIASAAYGSALDPEVMFLRGFRDDYVLKTYAGEQFMSAFNAWYYSFSPGVAQFISHHALLRTVVRGALYPLIGILRLSFHAYSIFASNPEVAVIAAGLVACPLIGIVYLAPFVVAFSVGLRRWRKIAVKYEEKALLFNTSMGLIAGCLIMLGEAFKIQQFMLVGTAAGAISILLGPSLIAIWLIQKGSHLVSCTRLSPKRWIR